MVRVVGLDIGSGYTKAYDGFQMVIFPSIYAYRQPGLWDENGIIEGVGQKALEIAQHPDAIALYPVVDGKPQHSAYAKLMQEACRRLHISFFKDICLVTGLPFDSGKEDRDSLKALLKSHFNLPEISIYPQAVGTLFDLDAKNGVILNIGHGTSEIAAIEQLSLLAGMSDPLASDYILNALSNSIQTRYGFKPNTKTLVDLISGKVRAIDGFSKASVRVRRHDIDDILQSTVKHLVDKISYDARALLARLPPGLACSTEIIVSGGGSMIHGVPELLERELKCHITQPTDPIFSNVLGFYKMGLRLHANS